MTKIWQEHNRLTQPIEDKEDLRDAFDLLMNSFEMYHELMIAFIGKELRHHDPGMLRHRTDGIDGLADSLRARASLIEQYLAPGDRLDHDVEAKNTI